MARGGKREGAGRKPGMDSAAKRDLIEMAKDHGQAAVSVLSEIMRNKAEAATARVSAATALLDRGYGRPTQTLAGAGPKGEHLVRTLDPTKLSTNALTELLGAMNEDPATDEGGQDSD